MSAQDRARWDRKWQDVDRPPGPSRLLVTHRGQMNEGVALDVACGLGQNSVWLAQHGYSALGVDLSIVALQRAISLARSSGVARKACFAQVDLDSWRPRAQSVDLVCVFRFLDRALLPDLRRALRPRGLFFFQTRHTGLLQRQPQASSAYLLQRGELAQLFGGWHILTLQEGDEDAAVVARKPRSGDS